MKVTGILVILFTLAGAHPAFAQNRTISGTVIDTGGMPVIGAAVTVVGNPQIGAATDLDGHFSFSVPVGSTISVESIGFKGQTFAIGDKTVFNIVLEEDAELLEETVVVGYGTQRKASLTSAISNIRSEELTATKQSDVLASLQGKVPGLLIRQRTGDAGDCNTDLKLRGYDEPLVIAALLLGKKRK